MESWMAFGKKRPSRHFELSDTMHENGQTCSGPRGAYPTLISRASPGHHRDLGSDVDRQHTLL